MLRSCLYSPLFSFDAVGGARSTTLPGLCVLVVGETNDTALHCTPLHCITAWTLEGWRLGQASKLQRHLLQRPTAAHATADQDRAPHPTWTARGEQREGREEEIERDRERERKRERERERVPLPRSRHGIHPSNNGPILPTRFRRTTLPSSSAGSRARALDSASYPD